MEHRIDQINKLTGYRRVTYENIEKKKLYLEEQVEAISKQLSSDPERKDLIRSLDYHKTLLNDPAKLLIAQTINLRVFNIYRKKTKIIKARKYLAEQILSAEKYILYANIIDKNEEEASKLLTEDEDYYINRNTCLHIRDQYISQLPDVLKPYIELADKLIFNLAV